LYNTPPVFAIYTMFLVLQWIKKNGGLKELEKINIEKAQTLYNEIDASCFYKPNAQKESRSNMNITFTLPNDDLTQKFIQEAKERNITGIKGHRKIGGIRASLYNAVTIDDVNVLVSFMKEFRRRLDF